MTIKKLAVSALALALLIASLLASGCSVSPDASEVPSDAALKTDAPSDAPLMTDAPLEIPVEKVLAVDPGGDNYIVFSSYDLKGGVSAHVDPEKKGTTREVRIGGREYTLYYTRTRHFRVGDYYCIDYDLEPPDEWYTPHPYWDHTPIGFYPSGALAYIEAYEFDRDPAPELEIEGEINVDSVRAAVEKLLESEADFGKLNFSGHYKEYQSNFGEEGTFGYYELLWFMEKDGEELPGRISASVNSDGELIRIELDDAEYERVQLPDGFDFEPYLAAVEKKARATYGADGGIDEYCASNWYATRIDGKEYVFVHVGLELSYIDQSFPCQYAVPLD